MVTRSVMVGVVIHRYPASAMKPYRQLIVVSRKWMLVQECSRERWVVVGEAVVEI